jgi:hypothetical protein
MMWTGGYSSDLSTGTLLGPPDRIAGHGSPGVAHLGPPNPRRIHQQMGMRVPVGPIGVPGDF